MMNTPVGRRAITTVSVPGEAIAGLQLSVAEIQRAITELEAELARLRPPDPREFERSTVRTQAGRVIEEAVFDRAGYTQAVARFRAASHELHKAIQHKKAELAAVESALARARSEARESQALNSWPVKRESRSDEGWSYWDTRALNVESARSPQGLDPRESGLLRVERSDSHVESPEVIAAQWGFASSEPPMPKPLGEHGGSETFQAEGELFVGGVAGTDPKQGNIANCYFAGAMSAIAYADPSAISDAIIENDDDTFTVRFFNWQGEPEYVTVDRELYGTPKNPLYARSTQEGELWPAIMEKAFAEWLGGYGATSPLFGRSSEFAIRAITGQPSEVYDAHHAELFVKIHEAVEHGKPVTALTHGNTISAKKVVNDANIAYWHVYAVFGTQVETRPDGIEERFVLLRNPWDATDYTGNAEYPAAEVQLGDSDDGIFRIPWDEFVRHYSTITIGAEEKSASS
ncbi:MAG: C2 family cysteine protease [Myxococcota bacterium]